MKLVSVIMPAYNAGKYIAETIQSVLDQTHTNWEMLIVDDGSTDNTAEIVKPFLTDKRIKYFYQQNGRQGKARNLAIEHSSGTYLAFLDADDLWVKDKLEKQLKIIEEKNVDVVYSQIWSFEENINNNVKEVSIDMLGLQDTNTFFKKLLHGNSIAAFSTLVKKEAVLKVGMFETDINIQNAEDYNLWLKLADSKFSFYGMEERLGYYRINPNQSTFIYGSTVLPSFWARKKIKFISITEDQKNKILFSEISNLIVNQTITNKGRFYELLDLYKTLDKNVLYYIGKLVAPVSPRVYKKIIHTIYLK